MRTIRPTAESMLVNALSVAAAAGH